MIFTRHETATCRLCDRPLLYAVKEEPTGWKVFVECSHEACSLQRTVGRVPAAAVDGMDAVHERASAMVAGR